MKDLVEKHLYLFAAVGVVAIAMYVFGLIVDQFELRIATKAFPMVALLALVGTKARGQYGRTIFVGLVLCLAGDLLLEFRQEFFLQGMIAFAAGHIAYIVAFARRAKTPAPLELLPFLVWISWALVVLTPGLGKMQIPVTVYTIAVMMWRATVLVREEQNWFAFAAMLGACFFGFSDTLIALDRFHEPIDGVRIPIILTYWTAQILIATSALGGDSEHEATQPKAL